MQGKCDNGGAYASPYFFVRAECLRFVGAQLCATATYKPRFDGWLRR